MDIQFLGRVKLFWWRGQGNREPTPSQRSNCNCSTLKAFYKKLLLILLALPSLAWAQTIITVDLATTLRKHTQKPVANMGTPTTCDSGITHRPQPIHHPLRRSARGAIALHQRPVGVTLAILMPAAASRMSEMNNNRLGTVDMPVEIEAQSKGES
jgi:hypothetical protein